jgi:type IV pilus assembly protein PilO
MRFGLREYILLALLLAMPLSSYWLVFRPQNAEIATAKREIQHKKDMLDKLREATSRNDDLQKANLDIERSIDAIEARLPTNKEVDGIVRQVSDLAVESGLEPPLMKSDKPMKASLYMEQPLNMSITGDFRNFYEFLVRVEQLPRITRIPTMDIKRAEDIDGHMKAAFTLSIYFQEGGQP